MRTASDQAVKQFGVLISCLAVRPWRMARLRPVIKSLAPGATMVAPSRTPFLSLINLTNPLRRSVILLRAVKVNGAKAIIIFRSRRRQSSSSSPVRAICGSVKAIVKRGVSSVMCSGAAVAEDGVCLRLKVDDAASCKDVPRRSLHRFTDLNAMFGIRYARIF